MLMSQVDLRDRRNRKAKQLLLKIGVALVQAILASISVWAICEVIK